MKDQTGGKTLALSLHILVLRSTASPCNQVRNANSIHRHLFQSHTDTIPASTQRNMAENSITSSSLATSISVIYSQTGRCTGRQPDGQIAHGDNDCYSKHFF